MQISGHHHYSYIRFAKTSNQGTLYPLYRYTFHVLCSTAKNVSLRIFDSTECIIFPMFLGKRLMLNLSFYR